MLPDEDIAAAVAAGVLDAQNGERLRQFLAARRGAPEGSNPDDERFRLIGGFNDIFVTIGIALVFGALGALAGPSIPMLIASAALAWALAEVFTRRYRMALPSIVLAVLFALVGGAVLTLPVFPAQPGSFELWSGSYVLAIGLACAAAAALHFWRFRVPVDVALAAGAAVGSLLGAIALFDPSFAAAHARAMVLAAGLLVFALAMSFDLSDPARATRRSDIAFWLHMLAAPMVVHGLLGGESDLFRQSHNLDLPLVGGALIAFTLVALVVDRRALIVSALTYAGGALYYLSRSLAGGVGQTALSLLVLGAVILALSIGWRPLRALIVPLLGGLAARLPPVRTSP